MRKPSIIISKADHERLTTLANGLLEKKPEMADALLNELERAKVASASGGLQGTVQMGATVDYESDDGNKRRVTLVYPADADIAQGKISILTPIGTALLGLKVGQSIDWTANDGRTHRLTIISVDDVVEAS